MNGIIQYITEGITEVSKINKAPELDKWLFFSTPIPLILLLTAYLGFVLFYGPRFMQNRKPFEIKKIILIYNGVMVISSALLIVYFPIRISGMVHRDCTNPEIYNTTNQRQVYSYVWWNEMVKLAELLDTIFFVLRKKNSQISFLHVYHHTLQSIMCWIVFKYLPAQQVIPIALVNAFIHTCMYVYYFMAALGPQYEKYLWWKKYMTKLQIIQFAGLCIYFGSVPFHSNCPFTKCVILFACINEFQFLVLFLNFYKNAYKKNKTL